MKPRVDTTRGVRDKRFVHLDEPLGFPAIWAHCGFLSQDVMKQGVLEDLSGISVVSLMMGKKHDWHRTRAQRYLQGTAQPLCGHGLSSEATLELWV